MTTEDKKRLGLGRSKMKNNDSDWHLHYALENTKKYVNKDGVQLNLNNKDKIGRNDPCYCGSGLKYKKCGMLDKCIKNS